MDSKAKSILVRIVENMVALVPGLHEWKVIVHVRTCIYVCTYTGMNMFLNRKAPLHISFYPSKANKKFVEAY